jgi:hypothetical protein
MRNGKIYKIIHNQSNICYVGSTFNTLSDRWKVHKQSYTQYLKDKKSFRCISIYPYFEQYDIKNFKIILIKEYEVIDRQHLEAYEQLWINKLKTVNKKCAFGFKRLQRKEYHKLNKDKINERNKNYQEKNKNKITEQRKSFREKNKDKIKEQHKKYRETNKEKIRDKKKEYYEANKDKNKDKRKENNENNKDRYKCEKCNISTYSKRDFNRHLQTKKHNK